jgi:hypothetical protein
MKEQARQQVGRNRERGLQQQPRQERRHNSRVPGKAAVMDEPLEMLLTRKDQRCEHRKTPRRRPRPLTRNRAQTAKLADQRDHHEHRADRQSKRQVRQIPVPRRRQLMRSLGRIRLHDPVREHVRHLRPHHRKRDRQQPDNAPPMHRATCYARRRLPRPSSLDDALDIPTRSLRPGSTSGNSGAPPPPPSPGRARWDSAARVPLPLLRARTRARARTAPSPPGVRRRADTQGAAVPAHARACPG